MDIAAIFLSGIRIIFGFLLVLLIPGLLISLVYFPKYSDLHIIERLVYATILSIGSVMVCVLFMDVVLGVDTTPVNIVIVITVFCLILALLWIIRSIFLTFSVTEKLSDIMKRISAYPARLVQGRMKNFIEKITRYKNTIQEKNDEDLQ